MDALAAVMDVRDAMQIVIQDALNHVPVVRLHALADVQVVEHALLLALPIALQIAEQDALDNVMVLLLHQYIHIKRRKNMRTLKIKINQDTVNYLERLHFEVEQRKDIIQRLIEAHAYDTDDAVLVSPAFKAYSSELSEFVAEYELAKQELSNTYIPKYLDGHNINWNLDFSTGQLDVNVLCDCKITELDVINQ